MTRARALALAVIFGCLCIALASRFAEAQYSPAGGNTFGGATYPLNVADAAGLSGPVPVSAGGTGVTSLQGGIALTKPCDLNGPTGAGACSYWNADLGVAIGDVATTIVSWTDQCNGYNPSQAINAQQPTWTANAWGTRHGVTWTANGTQALATNTSAAFAGAMTFGATFVPAANTNQAFLLDMPNGSVGGKISVYRVASSGAMTCSTGTTVGQNAQYVVSRPVDMLCINSSVQGANGSLLSSQTLQGGVTNAVVGSGGSNTSDGGIVLGNEWDGGSNSFAGTTFSILACTRELTQLEQAAYKSYQSTYYGGI